MKIKWIIIIATIAGIAYYFISPQIPAVVTVKNLTPTHQFGDTFSTDVTLTNYTPQTKEIYLSSSNDAAAVSVYVDYDAPIDSQPADKATAVATLSIPPFGHKTITIEPKLTQVATKRPVAIAGSSSVLPVSEGAHDYIIEVGGYASGKQTFSVQ